jgi:molybdenum cofactor guanylyltransferase
MKPHVKHPPVAKKKRGSFATRELAILGAPCSDIQALAQRWITLAEKNWQIGYMDADHQHGEGEFPEILHHASMLLTDKIRFFRKDSQQIPDSYALLADHNPLDLLLINGNHFAAAEQVLIIDPAKEKSILKRIDQLTCVRLILMKIGSSIPDPVLAKLGDSLSGIPILSWEDADAIGQWFVQYLQQGTPPLKALILAGGKSQRMGMDKSSIPFHGIPQRHHLANSMQELGIEAVLSVQQALPGETLTQLPDSFAELGPYGAILSAFRAEPDTAWLVMACDMPYADILAFQTLIQGRRPEKMATAFLNASTGFPDPLLTIYEPKAYLRLLQFLWLGNSCPRKMLINSDIALLEPQEPSWLQNVNTPEELDQFYRSQSELS